MKDLSNEDSSNEGSLNESLSNAAFHADCPLCRVAHHERFSSTSVIETKVYYEGDEIIVLDCKTCHVPMAVVREHKASVSDDVKDVIEMRFIDLFGEGSGRFTDEMKSIKGHYHSHWRLL